jgi:uncharacterized protein YciI
MFVAISTYLSPPEDVEALAPAHIAWQMQQYADGRFLGSGRRVPPTGAIIIGREESLEAFRVLLADDPFQQHGLVRYDIFEFTPVPLPRRSEELEAFLNKPLP